MILFLHSLHFFFLLFHFIYLPINLPVILKPVDCSFKLGLFFSPSSFFNYIFSIFFLLYLKFNMSQSLFFWLCCLQKQIYWSKLFFFLQEKSMYDFYCNCIECKGHSQKFIPVIEKQCWGSREVFYDEKKILQEIL